MKYVIELTSSHNMAIVNSFTEAACALRSICGKLPAKIAARTGETDNEGMEKRSETLTNGLRRWDIGLIYNNDPRTWQLIAHVTEAMD